MPVRNSAGRARNFSRVAAEPAEPVSSPGFPPCHAKGLEDKCIYGQFRLPTPASTRLFECACRCERCRRLIKQGTRPNGSRSNPSASSRDCCHPSPSRRSRSNSSCGAAALNPDRGFSIKIQTLALTRGVPGAPPRAPCALATGRAGRIRAVRAEIYRPDCRGLKLVVAVRITVDKACRR